MRSFRSTLLLQTVHVGGRYRSREKVRASGRNNTATVSVAARDQPRSSPNILAPKVRRITADPGPSGIRGIAQIYEMMLRRQTLWPGALFVDVCGKVNLAGKGHRRDQQSTQDIAVQLQKVLEAA